MGGSEREVLIIITSIIISVTHLKSTIILINFLSAY